MSIRAKFRCSNVSDSNQGEGGAKSAEEVAFHAAYEGSENKIWSEATPAGNLTMTISNKEAWGQFQSGKDYYLDFSEVPAIASEPEEAPAAEASEAPAES